MSAHAPPKSPASDGLLHGHAQSGVTRRYRHAAARLVRLFLGAARTQVQLTLHSVEDLRPLFGMPLVALVSVAILVHSNRAELAPYGLVAAVLMTVGQMGLFVASEIVFMERHEQTLELAVATPAPYGVVLLGRVLVLTLLGLAGAVESWLIVRVVFGLKLTVHHPALLALTLVASSLASAGTAMLTAALFSLGRQVRTFQNAINGPLYLLGGVLVPVTYLPAWLQPLSPFVFFYWSANLLRASFAAAAPVGAATGVAMILLLGAISAAAGGWLLRRMLDHLRREGTLGLT
jgi:ABC-2 type transport system permease protein